MGRLLRQAGWGTLLFDLLTAEEELAEQDTAHLRFDIPLLAQRLVGVHAWLAAESPAKIAFFGASTGAGAALVAAAQLKHSVAAVVSRGGRPDLAGEALPRVTAPTLLIVGAYDPVVIGLNQQAYDQMHCERSLRLVPGATHLFEQPGTLESAARLAIGWLQKHL